MTTTKADKLLIFADVHAPYHNKQSWQLMMQAAKKWKPDIIISLGDFLDSYVFNQHGGNDPRRARFVEQELQCANALLDELETLGATRHIFIAGNHEDRWRRWVADHAPSLYNIVRPEHGLRLKDRGWQYVPYFECYDDGKVLYTHDLGSSGSAAVRSAVAKAQHSICIGHIHRFDYTVAADIRGRPRVAFCPGWLGDVDKIDYEHALLAKTQWTQGFALAERWPDGITTFYPVPIVCSSARVFGEIYKL